MAKPEDAARKHLSIARHLSVVLKDPDTPSALREAIHEGLRALDRKDDNSPAYLAFLLRTHAEIQKEEIEFEGVSDAS
jgi:hypothetical protein